MKIGVLAVQGDYEAHRAVLERLGVEAIEVRKPVELAGCCGLILPGGESTTQLQFLQEEGLQGVIQNFAREGGALFGTCAGAILLAREVRNPPQDSLQLLDITILRNGYGRQLASQVVRGASAIKKEPLEMVFIRGPIIERAAPDIAILAEYAGKPTLVAKGNVMAATFHPELTEDSAVHEHFLKLARAASR